MLIKTYRNAIGDSYNLEIFKECPRCHTSIDPLIVFFSMDQAIFNESFQDFSGSASAVLACPACHELLFSRYKCNIASGVYTLVSWGPKVASTTAFPKEIESISPSFSNIYHQAEAAEAYDLHEIAGIGYRKALEFLVKDYAILMHPDEKGTIENAFLAKCIEKFIDQPKIKATAIAAVWLGNDEAHYTRKWVDKDINDLKQFIWTCHYWIMADYKASEASSMITDGNHNS